MDIMELGAIGELVGGAAVLATLIYLAVQISGSRQALKTQTHHNLLMAGQRPTELMLADAELADIVTRGHDDPTALSPGEWQRYSAYVFMMINAWEYGYYLSRSRSVPAPLWEGGNSYWSEIARTKLGVLKFWRENEHAFAEPFRSHAGAIFPASESRSRA